MGEERINKIKVDDLPESEQELTPEEAQRIKGGVAPDAAREGAQKRGSTDQEQADKKG
ncbi:MAG: hypothetical protein H7Y30_05415 [Pyrinomonadaceae bacterium]|nr:hypothetical protein [Pyrinomonadaceae bacterium]